MIRGIHHTAISTGNLDRALQFYCDLLGFEEVGTMVWEQGNQGADQITGLKASSGTLVMLKAGNAFIELFQYVTPDPKPGDPNRPVCDHGITHLCLDVVDVDEEYERLKAAGMTFHCPPQDLADGAVRTTYGRDPDGNVVELQELKVQGTPMNLPFFVDER
jgi:glyoxylase I family protein